jgi:hypothetical protein
MRKFAGAGGAALALALTIAVPHDARAAGCADKDKAGELANTGFDLFSKALYEEASELFRRADESCHSPAFVLFRARAKEKLGKIAEAQKLTRSVVEENLPAGAPEPFVKAKKDADELLAVLDKRVPVVTFKAPAGITALRVDGNHVDPAAGPMTMDPGDHEVVAIRADGKEAKKRFHLSEGDKVPIVVEAPADEADSAGPSGMRIGAGVALGIGGAAFLGFAISGGVFVGRASKLKDACAAHNPANPTDCGPDLESEGKSVAALGNAATALLVIGIAGIGAGIPLMILSSKKSEPAAALRVTPGGLMVSGHF